MVGVSQAHGSPVKDYELWIDATMFQMTLFMLPGFTFVPADVSSTSTCLAVAGVWVCCCDWLLALLWQEIDRVVRGMAWLERLFTVTTPFWDPVVERIQHIDQASGGTQDIVVVGHGFGEMDGHCAAAVMLLSCVTCVRRAGGGIAKIVGALTQHPAVSLAGPGLFITR